MTKSDILQDISAAIAKALKQNLNNIKKLEPRERKEIENVIFDVKHSIDVISNIGEASIKEAIKEPKSFETGHELLSFFKSIPEFRKYHNKDASYDDIYFDIPLNVFNKVLPTWTKDKVTKISNNLDMYTGDIHWHSSGITVLGGD